MWTLGGTRGWVSVPGIFLKANLFWNGERKNNQHRSDNNGKLAVSVPVSADCAVCFMSQGSYHCNSRGGKTDTKRELTTAGLGQSADEAFVHQLDEAATWRKTTSHLQATFPHSQHSRTRMCKVRSHERHIYTLERLSGVTRGALCSYW